MYDHSFMYKMLNSFLHKKGQILYQMGNSFAPFL